MIALAQSALIILISFIRIRFAYLGFVFLLPFMPRYLGIAVGNGSFTARRIIIIFFILLFAIWLARRHRFNEMIKLVHRNLGLISALVFLFIVKIISTVLNAGATNLLYVADDFLASMPVILMTMMLIRSDASRQSLLVAIVAGLFVSELLSIVEFFKQTPLLIGVVDFNIEGAEKIEAGKFRNDMLRAAALFDNPLLLSEFVCIAWPLSLYLYQYASSAILRTLAFFTLALVPVTLFFVASRAGWLIFLLTAVYMWLSFLWVRMGTALRLVIGSIIVVLSFMAFVGIIDVFQSPEKYFSGSESAEISARERINQYSVAATAFSERPLLGYGTQQNVAEDLDFINNLDNYWLRLIIESGLFGIVTFAIMLFLLFKKTSRLKRKVPSVYDKQLLFALMSSLMAFSVNLFFLSMPSNNIYFFIMAGLVAGWAADKKQLTPIQR